MTDGEAFLLVFILIYLSDCLVWLTPPGYALIAFWRPRFVVRRAAVNFSALRKGFAVLNPLPPFGTVFVCESWPISLTAEGIAPLTRDNPNPGPALGPPAGAGFLDWESVDRVGADGLYLFINGRRFALASTRQGARHWAGIVKTICALPPDERADAIDRALRRSFNTCHATRRAALLRRVTAAIRFNAGVLFFAVFIGLPFAYWRFHDGPRFFLVLLAIWLVMLWTVIEFFRLHRRFYPAHGDERWQHAGLALLFPHYTIRCLDSLSKGFLAGIHPLAAAAALAQPDELTKLARTVKRDARHPFPLPESGPTAAAAKTFHTRHFLPALNSALERIGYPEEARPQDQSETGPAECPRCGAPYEESGIPCEDCGGILTAALGGEDGR